MTKTKNSINFIVLSERVFLVLLIIGIVLTLLNVSKGKEALAFAFCGLGITSLIYAIVKSVLEIDVKASWFFKYIVIPLPKAIWLGASLFSFGIFLYLINFGYQYYAYLLGTGITSMALIFSILLVLWIRGERLLKPYRSTMMRAVPLLIIGLYIFLNY